MNAYTELWIEPELGRPDAIASLWPSENVVAALMATGMFDAEKAEQIAERLAVEESLEELLEEQE